MQKKPNSAETKPKSRIVGNGSQPGNKPAPMTSHRVQAEDRTRAEESGMAEEDDPLLDERDLEENRLTGDQDDVERDPDLGHARSGL